MAIDDNSVNIKFAKRAYHHGDLRASLLAAGLHRLETGSVEALSLREIARDVGVSATAIYRHFPDKESLLQALAQEGLQMLADAQAKAGSIGGREGFAASGRAYVRFALANPALFRLTFASMRGDLRPEDVSPEGSAEWLLRQSIDNMMGPDASDGAKFVSAMRAWSLVHGLAMLILDNQIDLGVGEKLIDEIISFDSLNLG